MAILHRKEEKIQAVLGRLSQNYTDEEFVNMFIKLYSKDWGKIKAAYIKQSQDKEPGTVINMPKPDLYLKQLAEIYIKANPPKATVIQKAPEVVETPIEKVKKATAKKPAVVETLAEPKVKKVAVKKEAKTVEPEPTVEKVKKVAVRKSTAVKETATETKAKKVAVKKKAEVTETPTEEVKKTKAVIKKKATTEETPSAKKKTTVKK